ncbi:hypothetical protein HBHAL_2613 [Halobacillus halophilus DSM 2266]|uniref:Uncharacterized protein n=1 Tax=Halobacillus halophilus (strain ATCC 35676 / DSM 2266 / JCM 20832 / KCTC 3685 / LMG 17431 / NBRC 102448 / NCIMB 2269) TaxID=866895 RepID=I0JLD9_HALH3|nr:hypothetical protein HBHAL_2613 [Halobacillus halophilus DSM 2266]
MEGSKGTFIERFLFILLLIMVLPGGGLFLAHKATK